MFGPKESRPQVSESVVKWFKKHISEKYHKKRENRSRLTHDKHKKLRASPQLEWWNAGIMGSGPPAWKVWGSERE